MDLFSMLHKVSRQKILYYFFFYDVFFNDKKGSKKRYMEMAENFYLETHMRCARSIHLSLLYTQINDE